MNHIDQTDNNAGKYIITRMDQRIYSFLLHNQKAVEIHCDEEQKEMAIGNIYIGKIKNIAKNIGAAFVEIAPGSVCYLPLDDMKHPIYTKKGSSKLPQAGDELLVQISQEKIKTKQPAVTTNLVFHGKYALLTTGKRNFSVSSKLSRTEKERLLDIIRQFEHSDSSEPVQGTSKQQAKVSERTAAYNTTEAQASTREYGWLLRTNAGGADQEILKADMMRLKQQYTLLLSQAFYRTCFSCLLRRPAIYLSRLTDLYESAAARIVTDDPQLHRQIYQFLSDYQPEDLSKLTYYQDNLLPLKKLYSLEHQLQQALQERVWLNTGGYLVIQPTEALTVIDVNSGKYEGGKKKEAAFLKINKEAAIEIARQLRLRNISGIIIVDFINMEEEESKSALLSVLDQELQKDPLRTVLVDMTRLSLVEITRKKKEKSLRECYNESV